MNILLGEAKKATILHRGPTLGLGMSHGMLVIAHPAATPDREDWEHVVRAVREHHGKVRGQLVVSRGGGPDAAQRKRALAELPKDFVPPPVAVITESLAVRGIITALNWLLNDNHRSFARQNTAGVAAHLRIDESDARALIAFAESLLPKP